MKEQNHIMPIKVLVVEDDKQQRELIESILTSESYTVFSASCVEEAILILKKQPVDVVFSDWKLGALSGIELLHYVRKNIPELGFAIATAYGTVSHAVEAMNAGADDYLTKPFQRQELLLTLDKIFKSTLLRKQNQKLNLALGQQDHLVELIGNAPCMHKVFDRIKRISNTDATVLINGESGTGKELAARALHKLSPRGEAPFIAINCGAIPGSLAEAELFGALKGAFTGADQNKTGKLEAADGGTVFLDEIGELPLLMQAKVLRFLQEGTITPLGSHEEKQLDVRVIAATHRDLQQMVADNDFREDLFYRLNVVPINMPSLAARKEDIPRLIEHFINYYSTKYNCDKPALTKPILKQLLDYHWPGNVRELGNQIERYVLLADEEELIKGLTKTVKSTSKGNFVLPPDGLNWEDVEKSCLSQALDLAGGNRTKAAQLLQLNYKAFLYRLEKHQLG